MSFGEIFDDRAFVHPSMAKDLEYMPLEGESQVAEYGADARQAFDDALSRALGGCATSAAGGAASPGQESLDSCDKYYYATLERSMKEIKATPLTRTLAGAELVEVVTGEMQLTLEQVASMAIPILVGPAGKFLRVFQGDNVSPSLYPYEVDRNMN